MAELAANNISVHIDGATIVADASLTVATSEAVALLGPNGAGKTSLMRALIGQIAPDAGHARLDDEETRSMRPEALARRIAYLPQRRPMAWPMRARDVVALGRFAYGASPSRLAPEDAAAVDDALGACGLGELAARRMDTLSGGEAARVHVARALASGADFLLADEPVASLDPLRQHEVMALIRDFADRGGGALAVLHDAALAARYADRIVLMRDGRIIADGPPREALTAARFEEAYGLRAEITFTPGGNGAAIRVLDVAGG